MPISGWRRWTRADGAFVRQHAGKLPLAEIAARLDRTPSAVQSWAVRWGVSLAVSLVEPHDVWLCRELYREGLEVPVIAKKMELSRRVVANIVYRRK
ncbi:hypothetical protein OUN72_002839 [Salmonella enterica subsp. enterica serovar Essen]|uniref:hypothetical protein n=1 Tax=Salmonella enterica TaxID=28901 RepID=UPI0030A82EC6|nr:hypothetical protein [Salmonella enterica]